MNNGKATIGIDQERISRRGKVEQTWYDMVVFLWRRHLVRLARVLACIAVLFAVVLSFAIAIALVAPCLEGDGSYLGDFGERFFAGLETMLGSGTDSPSRVGYWGQVVGGFATLLISLVFAYRIAEIAQRSVNPICFARVAVIDSNVKKEGGFALTAPVDRPHLVVRYMIALPSHQFLHDVSCDISITNYIETQRGVGLSDTLYRKRESYALARGVRFIAVELGDGGSDGSRDANEAADAVMRLLESEDREIQDGGLRLVVRISGVLENGQRVSGSAFYKNGMVYPGFHFVSIRRKEQLGYDDKRWQKVDCLYHNHFNAIVPNEDATGRYGTERNKSERGNSDVLPLILGEGDLAPSRYDTFRNRMRCLGRWQAWRLLSREVETGRAIAADTASESSDGELR